MHLRSPIHGGFTPNIFMQVSAGEAADAYFAVLLFGTMKIIKPLIIEEPPIEIL